MSKRKNKDEMYRIDRQNDLYISIDRPKYINRSKSMLLMNRQNKIDNLNSEYCLPT